MASERRFFLFKIHGDADDIQSIVLTKQDYKQTLHNSVVYRTCLSQILATRTILFVGYGLRDHDLNLVLEEQAALFKAYGRRHYALMPNPGTILPKSFLEHYNLSIIPYSSKNKHVELESMLRSLLKHLKVPSRKNENGELHKIQQLIQLEREYCQKLGTLIEPQRARFLKLHAPAIIDKQDRELIDKSIQAEDHNLSERQQLEESLRQSQKMEAIGQLAGGIAHDFHNILTIILGHCQVLSTQQLEKKPLASINQIRQASERAAGLTRQLLTFGRRQIIRPVAIDLNVVSENMMIMLNRLLGEDINLEFKCSPSAAWVKADITMIEQILLNLAVNARDAMPKGGRLSIAISFATIGSEYLARNPDARIGTFIKWTVLDTGCGIPLENMSRIFEPFFTTKEIGKGTGLGLATVYGIIKQHQGWIEVESKVSKGTKFDIFFPVTDQVTDVPDKIIQSPVRGGAETILVVEDERLVLGLVSTLLRSQGYTVLEAQNGVEAINIWSANREKIELVLTDLVMPEKINGRELAEILWAEQPSLKIIFTSGYGVDIVGKDFKLDQNINFLQKPYSHEMLARIVRSVLDTGRKSQ